MGLLTGCYGGRSSSDNQKASNLPLLSTNQETEMQNDYFMFGRNQTAYDLPRTVMLTDDPNPFHGYCWNMIQGTITTSEQTGVNQDYRGQHEQRIRNLIAQASGGFSTPFVGLNLNGAAFVAAWETYTRSNRQKVKRDFIASNIATEADASVNINERRERLKRMLNNDIIAADPTYVILGTSTVGGFGNMHLYKWSDEPGDFRYLKLLHQLTIRDVPDILMTPSTLRNTIIYEMDENQTVTLKHPLKNVSCAVAIVHLQNTRIEGDAPSIQAESCWENIIFPVDTGTSERTSQAHSLSVVSTAQELLALSQFGSEKISSLELSVRTLGNMSCYPTAKEGRIATYSEIARHVCNPNRRAPELRRVYVTYSSRMLAAAKHVIIG